MNEYKMLAYVAKELTTERNGYEASVCQGNVKDFAEYKGMCGVIKGLQTAQYEINDLLRKIKDDDDE